MYEFVNNWSSNPIVVKRIKEYLPSYFLQFKPEDRSIIYKLLENVEYYNEERLERILQRYFTNVEIIYENVKSVLITESRHYSASIRSHSLLKKGAKTFS